MNKRNCQKISPKIVLTTILVLLITGCMIGPDYKRPTVETPCMALMKEARTANTAWWEQFNDPVLNGGHDCSQGEQGPDVSAGSRFMGRYGVTRSALYPQVGASGTAGRERISEVDGPTPLSPLVNPNYDFYQVVLSASWELDIWGKLRRATEAARADLLSTEEARRAVVLTLVTSVASSYVTLRDLDKQLEITKQTAKTREESYKLFQLRFTGGVISELQLSQVKSEYEAALATIPRIEKSIGQQENLISILLGRNPRAIPRGKTIDELVPPSVPAGLPSDLLERRPDIRQAEQNLISANANIGVAKALYFPTISLTGFLGTSSASLSDLFSGPSKI
jgi:multidrug efflux system outer membrane protein